jgi:hypothetical protein
MYWSSCPIKYAVIASAESSTGDRETETRREDMSYSDNPLNATSSKRIFLTPL